MTTCTCGRPLKWHAVVAEKAGNVVVPEDCYSYAVCKCGRAYDDPPAEMYTMLDTLKFVAGSVATKDYQPELTHFFLRDGRIVGYNGTLAISSPIALDIAALPHARTLIAAVEKCTGTVSLHITDAGKLCVRSKRFRAYVPCHTDPEIFLSVRPDGYTLALPDTFIRALKHLVPFVGKNAERPWSTGVLLHGASAYATNNIALAQYWIGGVDFPALNIPGVTVRELLRIAEDPVAVSVATNSVTFHYSGERWLRTGLLDANWPNVQPMLANAGSAATPPEVPDTFFDAINTLAPFVDDLQRVFLAGSAVCTSRDGMDGAVVDIVSVEHSESCKTRKSVRTVCNCAPGDTPLPSYGCFQLGELRKLAGLVTHIDFSSYPNPCLFFGDEWRLRGVVLGMREDM